MKNIVKRILLSLAISGVLQATEMPSTSNFDVKNDSQALEYCLMHQNTYVVIVWPRGFHSLEDITNKLNEYASVKYVKTFVLDQDEAFLLYRELHKKMSHKSAKKYFRPYISPSLGGKNHAFAALVLQTDQPLEEILKWKKEIRAHIGESYYSMHINDYYDPQTVEAAQAVFKDLA